MKLIKNISLFVLFMVFASISIAQEQCALRLTDGTPTSGQYYAYIVVFYDGVPESTTSNFNVTVGVTNYLPFGIEHEVGDNLYRIAVMVYEPQTGWQGPKWSSNFNSDYWRNDDVDVIADL